MSLCLSILAVTPCRRAGWWGPGAAWRWSCGAGRPACLISVCLLLCIMSMWLLLSVLCLYHCHLISIVSVCLLPWRWSCEAGRPACLLRIIVRIAAQGTSAGANTEHLSHMYIYIYICLSRWDVHGNNTYAYVYPGGMLNVGSNQHNIIIGNFEHVNQAIETQH